MEKTASQISFGRRTRRLERRSTRGFTLVEVMVGASLSSMILAGVISTFLMMGRTGANIINYSEIEAGAREGLELFSREARMAYNVTAYSDTSVTLSIPDTTVNPTGHAYNVTYAFDSANKQITRDGATFLAGVEQISGMPVFNYYRRVTTGYTGGFTENEVLNATEIKQIEVTFQLKRKDVTVATATNKVLSARFILRNK
jgi:prepilin-type N-terminal cleavage/methylation domain-containing protein